MARVLHIEDDPNARRLVHKLLASAGHEVLDTASGLEGIRMASARKPDLVLVDINVPDLDGYEVTLRLRGIPSLKGVPIVAITAEGDRQTSLAVGADGFIQKPIDARRFTRTVERFLGGHRERADETGEVRLRERSQKIVERLERKVVQLSEANARLKEVARLRREFLQNVSHELATPMTPVVGYLRLLMDEEVGPLTPLQRKCLRSIEASTDRLRGVVDTLLDVSSLESGTMHFYQRPYDFGDEVRKAIQEIRPRIEARGLSLFEALPSTPMPAAGDAAKIRRALANMLDNALKFAKQGGRVAIEASTFENPISGAGPVHVCRIADDGPGIPKDDQAKVFEPFFQVDGSATRAHGGVGLGLAFAKRVAEAHGGTVHLQSPPIDSVADVLLPGTVVSMSVGAHARGAAP